MEVDMNKIRILAESAERRANDLHAKANEEDDRNPHPPGFHSIEYYSLLNDFFYWSGKATSYRGIIAMAELQQIVEDELDSEGSCP